MSEKFYLTIIIGLIGVALTAVRRWKNKDNNAGLGVAGWTIFIIFILWT
ncbi:hypothetical protein LCGC14_3150190 [marine sediment metagenome]|uniref:Uncharacterized protein n=1 Tax=marine sediment metagenome TaxID=412755 RepID=A0A0F8WID9_9ZZZZ